MNLTTIMNKVTIEEHCANLSRLATANGLVFNLEYRESYSDRNECWLCSKNKSKVLHRFTLTDDWPKRVASVIEYLSR